MKKQLIVLVLSIGLVYPVLAQSNNELRQELTSGKLINLVAKYDKRQIILHLFNFTECCFDPKTDVWYNLAAVDTNRLIDAAIYEANSLKMKAYYWIWLIATKNESAPHNYYGVLKISKDSSIISDLGVSYTYNKTETPPYKESHASYRNQEDKHWVNVQAIYKAWIKKLESGNIADLQKQGDVPLSGTSYEWLTIPNPWPKK